MSSRNAVQLLLLLLVLLNATSCLASAKVITSIQVRASETSQIQTLEQEHCGFEGNPDIYGIGIRVGYYTQAFSVWFANFFVLREAKILRAVNTLFMFAMFVGLIVLSHNPSQIFAAEVYLLVQIILVTWYIGALDVSRYSRRHWHFDFERTVIRNGSFIGMSAYNVWFWWTGLDIMQKTPCGTFGFFFSRVDMFGWYRKASMALGIVTVCFNTLLDCGHFFRILRHLFARGIRSVEYYEQLMGKLNEGLDDLSTAPNLDIANNTSLHESRKGHALSSETIITCNHDHRANQRSEKAHSFLLTKAVTMPASTHLSTRLSSPDVGSFHSDSDSPHEHAQTSMATTNTAGRKNNGDDKSPTFQELYGADTYISHVLSACPSGLTQTNRFQITLWKGALKLYIPYLSPPRNDDAVSLRICLNTAVTATRRKQLNLPALAILFSHIYALQTHPFYRYPWLFHSALTCPTHAQQDWRTLTTVADIRLTQQPDETRKWYWIPSAVQSGVITVGLVLAVELTIAWNSIRNVNNIGTVGQLVPFILGCGGLIKVLWSRLRMSWQSEIDGGGDNDKDSAEVRLADVYYKRKEVYERSMGFGAFDGVGTEDNV